MTQWQLCISIVTYHLLRILCILQQNKVSGELIAEVVLKALNLVQEPQNILAEIILECIFEALEGKVCFYLLIFSVMYI